MDVLTPFWSHLHWRVEPVLLWRECFLRPLTQQMRLTVQAQHYWQPISRRRLESLVHCPSPLGYRGAHAGRSSSDMLTVKFTEGSAARLHNCRGSISRRRHTGEFSWSRAIRIGISTHYEKTPFHPSIIARFSSCSRWLCRQQHTLVGFSRPASGSPPAPPWRVTLVGRANVGKSSVYNRFLVSSSMKQTQTTPHQLAVVDPYPGTTRDRKEALCSCGPLSLLITDTPGIEASIEDTPFKPMQQICTQVRLEPCGNVG